MKLNPLDWIVGKTQHYTAKQSLKMIKDTTGKERTEGWLSQRRKYLNEHALEILFEDAKNFPANHVARVMVLKDMLDSSLKNKLNETDPLKIQHIIDSIVKLQYDLASFDEATKNMIEGNVIDTTKTSIHVSEEQSEKITV